MRIGVREREYSDGWERCQGYADLMNWEIPRQFGIGRPSLGVDRYSHKGPYYARTTSLIVWGNLTLRPACVPPLHVAHSTLNRHLGSAAKSQAL